MDTEAHNGTWIGIGSAFLVVGGGALVSLGIWAQNTPSPHLWLNRWFDLLMFALSAVTVIGGYAVLSPLHGLPMPRLKGKPTSTLSQPGDVDLDRTYLAGLFKEHTEVQVQKLIANYLGKWTQFSGSLGQVTAGNFNKSLSHVTFEGPLRNPFPSMSFRGEQWAERLSIMRRGTPITVRGRITEITNFSITLDDCELVN